MKASELCPSLYGSHSGTIAVFTDFFCPNCRRLEAMLAAYDPKLTLVWHQLPLLGPNSTLVARAMLAADLQGAHDSYHSRLLVQPVRPSANFLADVAASLGLDRAQFLEDMNGEEVARRLLNSRRAAETLGLFGTPGLTWGKTLVIGAINKATLADILTLSSSC